MPRTLGCVKKIKLTLLINLLAFYAAVLFFIMQLTLLVQGSGNVKKRFGKLVDFSKRRNYRGGSTGLPYIVSLKKLNKLNENN